MPALDAPVALITCTLSEAPEDMSPRLQVRVCEGALPVIEHMPAPVPPLIAHETPGPAGSGSFTLTERAVPVPPADELDTETVKPIDVPPLTAAASAVFVTDNAGASTVVAAVAWTGLARLVADAVAVVV